MKELEAVGKKLDLLSKYRCEFDYEAYRKFERRYVDRPIRGGIFMRTSDFRLCLEIWEEKMGMGNRLGSKVQNANSRAKKKRHQVYKEYQDST